MKIEHTTKTYLNIYFFANIQGAQTEVNICFHTKKKLTRNQIRKSVSMVQKHLEADAEVTNCFPKGIQVPTFVWIKVDKFWYRQNVEYCSTLQRRCLTKRLQLKTGI